jgi:hypothetical protein
MGIGWGSDDRSGVSDRIFVALIPDRLLRNRHNKRGISTMKNQPSPPSPGGTLADARFVQYIWPLAR